MHRLSSDEIKKIELTILLEFDRFCKGNNLRYLLAFGTALGAMRHGGFIPWDDDIDVIMPREDYEHFLAIYPTDNTAHYKLTIFRDESSVHHFAKLTDTNTLVHETYLNPRYTTGLWIDIFPIDKVAPGASLSNTIMKMKWLFCLWELSVSNPNEAATKPALALKTILRPFAAKLNQYKLSKQMDDILISLNETVSNDSTSFGWVCLDNQKAYAGTFPDRDLFPAQPMKFEGHEFPVPHDIDANLTECYGDWRQLPPESERIPHFTEAFYR